MVRIKELRLAQGLSQKELAVDLHVSQATVSAWESGSKKMSNASASKVADYFNVSLDFLLDRTVPGLTFADGMRAERKRQRLSQMELSDLSGVPQSTISAVESGARKPTEDTMVMIAAGLRCTVSSLLGDSIRTKEPAAIYGDELRAKVIDRIMRLSDPAFGQVLGYLDGLSAGLSIGSAVAADPDPDVLQSR